MITLLLLPLFLLGILGSIATEIVLVILIGIVLFLIFKVGGFILRALSWLIINGILGLVSLYVLDTYFSLGIVLTPLILIAIAIFGLPGVFVLVILKLLGIAV
jgi:hypothetical protein